MDTTVIVIGGGAAGLLAAADISAAGKRVILLEARPQTGGRMFSLHPDDFEQTIEAGAEFIHGALPLTRQLLEEAAIPYAQVKGKMLQVKEGHFSAQENFIEGWDELIEKMATLENDMPLADFLQQYFNEPRFEALRRSARGFAEGFDLADIHRVSTKALYREWSQEEGDEQYRVTGGYGRLVDYLHRKCLQQQVHLYTNAAVKKISWQPAQVTVDTHDGRQYTGSRVLLAVPLPVLQDAMPEEEKLLLAPELPAYRQAAITIGYGNVTKLMLQFKQAFWTQYRDDAGFLFTGGDIATWWTQSPNGNALLTGWLGSGASAVFARATEQAICMAGIRSLATAFHLPEAVLKEALQSWYVINWSKQPFIRGGYSYDTPGTAAARQLLNTPVANTIFFAGEALYAGQAPGTVEAALVNGRAAAQNILAAG